VRKATLASLLRSCPPGVRLNEHLTHDGNVVFRHACKMGLEGIVSKRLGSTYGSGKCKDWLKFKNPGAPAVKQEAEEDWGTGQLRCTRQFSPAARSRKQSVSAAWRLLTSMRTRVQIGMALMFRVVRMAGWTLPRMASCLFCSAR
jgi:hypothetical protein